MKTTSILALLALGTMALATPLASALDLDAPEADLGDVDDKTRPFCYIIAIRPGSTTINGPSGVVITVGHGVSRHIASGCIG